MLASDPVRSKFFKQRVLCRTLAGNYVYVLTITAPAKKRNEAEVRFKIIKKQALSYLSAFCSHILGYGMLCWTLYFLDFVIICLLKGQFLPIIVQSFK